VEWPLRHQVNLFLSRLDEQQRRWHMALESEKMGHGGDVLLSRITGLDVETIRRGGRALDDDDDSATRPADRIRMEGDGRPALEKKPPRSQSG
jgi:uncharacterized protein with PhoU and TrkA domain